MPLLEITCPGSFQLSPFKVRNYNCVLATLMMDYLLVSCLIGTSSTLHHDGMYGAFVDHHHEMCPSVKDRCGQKSGMSASIGDQTSVVYPSDLCCGFCTCDSSCDSRTCCLAAYDSFEDAILNSNMATERYWKSCYFRHFVIAC